MELKVERFRLKALAGNRAVRRNRRDQAHHLVSLPCGKIRKGFQLSPFILQLHESGLAPWRETFWSARIVTECSAFRPILDPVSRQAAKGAKRDTVPFPGRSGIRARPPGPWRRREDFVRLCRSPLRAHCASARNVLRLSQELGAGPIPPPRSPFAPLAPLREILREMASLFIDQTPVHSPRPLRLCEKLFRLPGLRGEQ